MCSVEEKDKGGSEFLHCKDPANVFRYLEIDHTKETDSQFEIFWKQTRLYENFNHDSYPSHFLIWEKLRIYEFCAILMLLTQGYQMVLPKVHILFF